MRPMDPAKPHSAAEDFELLTRAHKGDALAARLLVMRLSTPAHRLAWRMLGDRALAEDVVQEGLEKLFRIQQYQGDARLSTYFHTLVSRLCLDRLRALDPVRVEAELTPGAEDPDPGPDPEQAASQLEQVSAVQRAIQRLAPRQRMAVALWAYHDFSVADIAHALQIERNAADQLLHRAKARLKLTLESEHAA